MSKIDIDKFVCYLMNDCKTNANYVHLASIKRALQDQGLEYKDGEIVSLDYDTTKDLRQRYKRIKNSEWLKKTHEGMSIALPSDLKGTDMDGGIKGEIENPAITEVEKFLYGFQKGYIDSILEWDDYVMVKSTELLNIARRQLEGNPEFLYTVTRKAAEMARRHFLDKACKWLDDNFLLYWSQVDGDNTDRFIRLFRKYMEEEK